MIGRLQTLERLLSVCLFCFLLQSCSKTTIELPTQTPTKPISPPIVTPTRVPTYTPAYLAVAEETQTAQLQNAGQFKQLFSSLPSGEYVLTSAIVSEYGYDHTEFLACRIQDDSVFSFIATGDSVIIPSADLEKYAEFNFDNISIYSFKNGTLNTYPAPFGSISAAWSPDSSRLAIIANVGNMNSSNQGSQDQFIGVLNVTDGSWIDYQIKDEMSITTQLGEVGNQFSWSPDGKWLAFY